MKDSELKIGMGVMCRRMHSMKEESFPAVVIDWDMRMGGDQLWEVQYDDGRTYLAYASELESIDCIKEKNVTEFLDEER